MTLLDPRDADAARRRRAQRIAAEEEAMEEATGAAMRAFLRRFQREALRAEGLTAAAPRAAELFTLGEASRWWDEAVDEHLVAEVSRVWRSGYTDTRDGELLRSSLDGMDTFVANVKDRLVRTAQPTVPEGAFDTLRTALADEWSRGSSTRQISDRIGAEFGWDEDARFWQGRLSEVDAQIDEILDPLDDAARRAARQADPRVDALQRQRSEAIKHIEADRSTWQTRSDRIARTETTSAYNAATEQALVDEGVGVKVWLSAGEDGRTRDEHLDADGQCVPVDATFSVGGEALMMPGDPGASPGNIVNCRCSMIGASTCAEAEALMAGSGQ